MFRLFSLGRPRTNVYGPVPDAVGGLVIVWTIVSIHELGQYVAGRFIVGIPAEQIRLQSWILPRYVALADDTGEWVAPNETDRYDAAYDRHDPEGNDRERFAAAGEIVQTAIVVPTATTLAIGGWPELGGLMLSISLLTIIVFVIVDASMTVYSGHQWGDYSRLWAVDRKIPPVLLFGFVAVHLGAVNFIV